MPVLSRLKLAELKHLHLHGTLPGELPESLILRRPPPPVRGRPRAELRVPVLTEGDVTDTRLFEDAANPALRFWLPRYALATEDTSAGPRYRARLAGQAGQWRLDFTLGRHAAPELGTLPADVGMLDHTTEARLRWERSGVLRELPFTERLEHPDGTLGVALTVATLPEHDELYTALTSQDAGATLIVTRTVRVGVRVVEEPPPRPVFRVPKRVPFDDAPGPRPRFPVRRLSPDLLDRLIQTLPPTEPGPDILTTDRLTVLPVADLARFARPAGLRVARTPHLLAGGLLTDARADFLAARTLDRTLVRDHRRLLPLNLPLPTPQVTVGTPEFFDQGGELWARYPLRVTNAAEYGDDLFAPSPDLPPCGTNTNSARTWVDIFDPNNSRLYGFCALGRAADLEGLWVAVPVQTRPAGVSVELVDRRAGRSARSATVALPPPELFTEVTRSLTSEETLFFHPGLHAYVFPGQGMPGTGTAPGLTPHTLPFGGASHRYYQDHVRPETFRFLPDVFKLAREDDPPHRPRLTLEALAPNRYRLTFVARPSSDLDRLEDARVRLARHLPAGHPRPVRLEPFHTSHVRFIPDNEGLYAGGSVQTTNFTEVRGAVELEGEAFARVWDELTGALTVGLGGKLRAEVGGLPAEEVGVVLRLDDTLGECLSVSAEADAERGGYRVTLTNTVESPLRVSESLVSPFVTSASDPGAELRPARWDIWSALSDPLRPGEEIRALLKPVDALTPGDSLANWLPVVDTDRVRAVPDVERITAGMLVGTLRTFERVVTVEVPAHVFAHAPDPAHPERRLLAVLVDFERGDTAELLPPATPDVPLVRGEATVAFPLLDLLLGRPASEYHYRVLPVYTDGPGQPGERRSDVTERLVVGLG
ncbi:hypothetical protein V3W47_03620 [Deinococcus sp. YIM 134068]|uniref:hypothetical protein n=1 Tax=Deinococcus lichenicola TaxID=3118910 RepID=UPI002F936FCD